MNIDLPLEAKVSSLRALHVVTDSQRHRILCMLIREPLTAAQIAKKRKITRTRVYYHLGLLEKHGFIHVVQENPVGARIERTYRARAQHFGVDSRVLAGRASEAELNDVRARQLESSAEDLRGLGARSRKKPNQAEALVTRQFLRLSEERARELRKTLAELATQYGSLCEEGEPYEMTIALFANEGEG